MTKYLVTFTEAPTQPSLECDEYTIWEILNDLNEDQLDAIFIEIVKNTLACSREPYRGFEGKLTWNAVREEAIHDEIEWMLDMMDSDPQLAEGFTHWGIHVEVVE